MPPSIWFSVGLVASSIFLIVMHLVTWRKADHGALTDADQLFYQQQYQRRTTASGLLGIIGVLLSAESILGDAITKSLFLLGIASAVCVTLVLALSDWLATRKHYEQHKRDAAAEHALLRAEIERYHREQSDQHRTSSGDSTDTP